MTKENCFVIILGILVVALLLVKINSNTTPKRDNRSAEQIMYDNNKGVRESEQQLNDENFKRMMKK